MRVFAVGRVSGFFACGKLFLLMLSLFVIQLIDRLHGFARDQLRDKVGLIRGERCQDIDAWVKRHKQIWIKSLGELFLGVIDHFEHKMIGFRNDANLLD